MYYNCSFLDEEPTFNELSTTSDLSPSNEPVDGVTTSEGTEGAEGTEGTEGDAREHNLVDIAVGILVVLALLTVSFVNAVMITVTNNNNNNNNSYVVNTHLIVI